MEHEDGHEVHSEDVRRRLRRLSLRRGGEPSDSPCGRIGGAQTVRAAPRMHAAAIIHETGMPSGCRRADAAGTEADSWPSTRFQRPGRPDVQLRPAHRRRRRDQALRLRVDHALRAEQLREESVDRHAHADQLVRKQKQAGGTGTATSARRARSRPVIFHVDNPGGANTGYYLILWGLDPNGIDRGESLCDIKPIRARFGDETQDGGNPTHDINRTATSISSCFPWTTPARQPRRVPDRLESRREAPSRYLIGRDADAAMDGNSTQGAGTTTVHRRPTSRFTSAIPRTPAPRQQ